MTRKILTLVALTVITITTATAQTVQIKTVKGERKTYNLSQIESITFSDEARADELVKMDAVNICAYSFDLQIEKSASCQKYMAAVYNKNIFNESSFVESAEQTLDLGAYYRPFEQTLSYDSGLFSEAQVGLNAVASEDGKTAPQFVAAVYAIDDLGETKVYTQEFSVPAKAVVESTEKATITIDESTLRFNHLDYSVRCGWNTAKVIYAVTQPSYIDSKLNTTKWNAMSREEQEAKLLSVYQGIPEKYRSGIKGSYDCSANSTCIIYAIPIDRNGKIGQMDIKTINTGAPELNGKGAFTGVSAVEQTEWDNMSFNISVDDNTVAYRLMWFTETDNKNSDYTSRIAEVLLDSRFEQYGTWTEFSCEQTTVSLSIYRPGENYMLYGAAVDRFGNLSKPVNLLETYLGKKTIATMQKPAEEDED